jgi:hypothetical protein
MEDGALAHFYPPTTDDRRPMTDRPFDFAQGRRPPTADYPSPILNSQFSILNSQFSIPPARHLHTPQPCS